MRAVLTPVAILLAWCCTSSAAAPLPASAHNLLIDAKITGNLDSFGKNRRGEPDHPVYDPRRRRFMKESRWHEYGVGFGQDLGVVHEDRPAWWMARWPGRVEANYVSLSGVYPNQPQPETCWKIEIGSGPQDGPDEASRWKTLARGKGGWYDGGRYTWGGPGTEPVSFDAFRVSLFSKDERTPLKSIHFRGEKGVSWVVARLSPIDARIGVQPLRPRAGERAAFTGTATAGDVKTWEWDFGEGAHALRSTQDVRVVSPSNGAHARGQECGHTYSKPGVYEVRLTFSDGRHTGEVFSRVKVGPPVEARISPMTTHVLAGRAATFSGGASIGPVRSYEWDFGDGRTSSGRKARHTFAEPGIYEVGLTVSDGTYRDECLAIVRAHTVRQAHDARVLSRSKGAHAPETLHVPQVVLDTDQKNEQDDQHYFGYGLFSQLDILGVNSVHHGGGQEPVNYREILNVLDLAKRSGLPARREPFVFRGANERLRVPESGNWQDTEPIVTDASEAILAAARGASPSNPVWVVPVGPGTNVASAVLQARSPDRNRGLDLAELKKRLRVMWLGGSNRAVTGEFNGNNDPWSMYVVAQSGLETWIMPAPVGARVRIDKRKEGHLYAENPLGQYLRKITPARNKPLFDPSCLSAIISLRLRLGWVRETEPVTVGGPDEGYRWKVAAGATKAGNVRVIRQIDQEAMKRDIFETMKGEPTRLVGVVP